MTILPSPKAMEMAVARPPGAGEPVCPRQEWGREGTITGEGTSSHPRDNWAKSRLSCLGIGNRAESYRAQNKPRRNRSHWDFCPSQRWHPELPAVHPQGESCGNPTRKPREWGGGKERDLEDIFLPLLNQHLSPENSYTA